MPPSNPPLLLATIQANILMTSTATLLKFVRDKVRVEQDFTFFNHDFYWVSQLYDKDWVPGPTA